MQRTTILFKSCPRCYGGDIYFDYSEDGDLICLQCGFRRSAHYIIPEESLPEGYRHKVGFIR